MVESFYLMVRSLNSQVKETVTLAKILYICEAMSVYCSIKFWSKLKESMYFTSKFFGMPIYFTQTFT